MLIRRRIGTAHNFANKPVSFACNGVQIRRRVSHKAGTEKDGRTAQNSRNTSRARKKNLQKAAQRAAACLMIDGKQRAASRAHNGGEARGRDIRKGARLRTVGGYRGEIGARVEGRQAGTTRRKGSACRSGVGAAPRARVYI